MPQLNLRFVPLVFVITLAALAASSCVNEMGVGVGVGHPTSWGGGGTAGPPVFVGGPR